MLRSNEAYLFAESAHKGQVRKYTGDPYIVHPCHVADLVLTVTGNVDMYCAALLHDTVEDTDTALDDIRIEFGQVVAQYVDWLTDISVPSDGNRATRKAIDCKRLGKAPSEVQTIKLADLINNSGSILEYDQRFAKVYMEEKRLLLEVLTKGDKGLHDRASKIVSDYFAD
ncbi:MAG: HD domain-containing protein [Oleispira sp.]|nr:HD domain-containing protein [Oleispira sp.]